ncbi:hypothetical protein [Roseateles chitosanitabidus]|uniref:hypothetical protein n=1 Tax=Roseateles chitosanitabidus TaxID=65048 RepID=UPI0008315C98|nr:hypothetical protein [Roseateles chitosanitabidus]
MRKLIVGVIGALGAFGVMAGTPPAAAQPASVATSSRAASTSIDEGGLEVRLEPRGGRRTFSQGEPIVLDLVLVARDGGTAGPWIYAVDEQSSGVSRQIDISPATGWFRARGVDHFDMSSMRVIGAKPVRLPVVVNRAISFQQPGRYELAVTTAIERRVTAKPSDRSSTRITTAPLMLTITAADEGQEAARVATLVAAIEKGGACRPVEAAARQLAFLGGETATREKARLFTAPGPQCADVGNEIRMGLGSSRHLPLQLELLHAAWIDSAQAPDQSLLSAMTDTRAFLRGETVPGWQGIADLSSPQALRTAQDAALAVEELVDSLPRREGRSQADTAYTLIALLSLDEAQRDRVRPFVLRHFTDMSPLQRGMLMSSRDKVALCGAVDTAPDEWLSAAGRQALIASCTAS